MQSLTSGPEGRQAGRRTGRVEKKRKKGRMKDEGEIERSGRQEKIRWRNGRKEKKERMKGK